MVTCIAKCPEANTYNIYSKKLVGTNIKILCDYSLIHTVKGYPVIDGVTRVEGVSFARFFDEGCIYASYAVGNNPLSPDAVHPVHMTGTTKFNVSLSSLVFFYEPNIEWIVQEVGIEKFPV